MFELYNEMNYTDNFSNRINTFMYAVNKYEHCMEYEFKTIINELGLKNNDVVVSLGGGGLRINKYIEKEVNVTYLSFDFLLEWCQCDDSILFCTTNKIPLPDAYVDKIIILAVLHHFSNEERIELYKECYRILKKSGKFIVADVIKNSNQDIWLNQFVNKYNPFGHNGTFFDFNDAKILENQDFDLCIKCPKYCWWFNNKLEMLDYVKNLFHLKITDKELEDNLNKILKPFKENGKYYFHWELMYFICNKN